MREEDKRIILPLSRRLTGTTRFMGKQDRCPPFGFVLFKKMKAPFKRSH
jgi:hypothetical protein